MTVTAVGAALWLGVTAHPSSVQAILSKVNKGRKWRSSFEAGVIDLDVDRLHQLLTGNLDEAQSGIRHEVGFYTPLGQDRRFKVWIPEAATKHSGSQRELEDPTRTEGSRGVGSALLKAGPGVLSTPSTPRLKADVALPGHLFDCRLLIRTGLPYSASL